MSEPTTPGTWWAGALATATSVWQAFVVPGMLGVWAVYKYRSGKADAGRAVLVTREQGYMDRLQEALATANQQNATLRVQHEAEIKALQDRHEAELQRRDARLAEVERDRDRGWDLARWWNSKANALRHDFANFCARKRVEWTMPHLPDLEGPK